MKIKKYLCLVIILVVSFILSGCVEQQQIYQKLIIQGIGIDCENKNEYIITIQALDFKNPVNEDEPNTKTFEIRGTSLAEALENISKQTSLTPVYSQNLIIVLGKKVAQNGINNFMDFFIRHCETRPKVKLCITEKEAANIFRVKSNNKPIKAKDIHDLIPDELNSDILHFVSDLKSNISDSYMAWISPEFNSDGDKIKLNGIGVFSDDILKDFIEEDMARGFMILKCVPNFNAYNLNLDNIGDITCLINKSSNNTKAWVENDDINFEINLKSEAVVHSIDKKIDAYFYESIKNEISNSLCKTTEHFCKLIIDYEIKNGIDVLGWGRVLKNSNPHYFKNIEADWKEKIKKCKYKIVQTSEVKITGKEPI